MKEKVETNEVAQDNLNENGNGGNSGNSIVSEKRDSGLWWVGGFLLALIILAAVLAII